MSVAKSFLKLSRLEDTISKVSLVLSELRAQQQHRTESLAPLKCALAPIRRIPPEILGEIFRLCDRMEVEDRFSETDIADPAAAPLILGHVCSFWRTVSQNTPQLWDRVCLRSNVITPHTLQFIRTLFGRSRSLPLNVQIYTSSGDNGRCLGLLWEFRERLQHLRLFLDSDDHLPTITPDHNPLPALKSLLIFIFQTLPSSEILLCRINRCHWDLPNCAFPWSQLTFLQITMPIDAAAVRHILFQCVRLEQCSLNDIDCEDYVPPTLPRTLNSLLSFQLTPNLQGHSKEFVRSFTFPTLRALHLRTDTDNPFAGSEFLDGPVVLELQARSHFGLKSLSFWGLAITLDNLLTFLRLIPSLQDLDMTYCDCVTNTLFSAFTYVPGSSASLALPKLEMLKIQEITDNPDGSAVADMVDSLRSHAGDIRAPFPLINSVVLDLDGGRFSDAVEDRLANAVSIGFLLDEAERP
ncbi:hypothetical protein B0H16DRAFT_1799654 [Mycena metata]|uniref:F-box domain-containing protein n=1 Tax=Mycena metata TaxID=1033252 RepID=A0AAD7NK51_9AGAR|nr:hypothetical protein B0H16DRAFT_1799654 [Mycena metata]